jgi:hypothetical protein
VAGIGNEYINEASRPCRSHFAEQESTSPSLVSTVLCSGLQVLVHSSFNTFSQTHAPRPRSCSVLYLAYDVVPIMSVPYMTLSQNYIIPTDQFPYSTKAVLERSTQILLTFLAGQSPVRANIKLEGLLIYCRVEIACRKRIGDRVGSIGR